MAPSNQHQRSAVKPKRCPTNTVCCYPPPCTSMGSRFLAVMDTTITDAAKRCKGQPTLRWCVTRSRCLLRHPFSGACKSCLEGTTALILETRSRCSGDACSRLWTIDWVCATARSTCYHGCHAQQHTTQTSVATCTNYNAFLHALLEVLWQVCKLCSLNTPSEPAAVLLAVACGLI